MEISFRLGTMQQEGLNNVYHLLSLNEQFKFKFKFKFIYSHYSITIQQ